MDELGTIGELDGAGEVMSGESMTGGFCAIRKCEYAGSGSLGGEPFPETSGPTGDGAAVASGVEFHVPAHGADSLPRAASGESKNSPNIQTLAIRRIGLPALPDGWHLARWNGAGPASDPATIVADGKLSAATYTDYFVRQRRSSDGC
jgi:hypothetical protein